MGDDGRHWRSVELAAARSNDAAPSTIVANTTPAAPRSSKRNSSSSAVAAPRLTAGAGGRGSHSGHCSPHC